MTTQNYANHRRLDPMFHGVLFGILVLTFGGSIVNLVESLGDHTRLYSAALLVALTFGVLMMMFFCRAYALKAQDRAIRAEENLRHYTLTGKLLDPKLAPLQIVALRFAPDDEFPALARRAAEENMAPDAIKRSIGNWKPDTYRV